MRQNKYISAVAVGGGGGGVAPPPILTFLSFVCRVRILSV